MDEGKSYDNIYIQLELVGGRSNDRKCFCKINKGIVYL